MPADPPALPGLEPVEDEDEGARFEESIHDLLARQTLETIASVVEAARSGDLPHKRALGLIQGTAEHGRRQLSLYDVGVPDFEEDPDGGLRRRVRRTPFGGGQAEMLAELRQFMQGLLDIQRERHAPQIANRAPEAETPHEDA